MPSAGPDEVLVQVRAAGINPSDLANLRGRFHATLPRTPGRDFAGVVIGGGPWDGKEVWGSGKGFGVTRDGTHAEYLAIPTDWLAEKPSNLSMEQAASIGIPYLVSWMALIRTGEVREGETVLITGASGAVGRAATQIAHWRRARVIGVDKARRPNHTDEFIDSTNSDVSREARRLTGGKGVDLVLDTVAGPLFEPCLRSLRMGGRQIAIAGSGDGRVEFNIVDFYHNLSRLIGVDSMKFAGPEIAAMMNELRPGFEEGQLQPPETDKVPLGNAIKAYTAIDSKQSKRKQVITMD